MDIIGSMMSENCIERYRSKSRVSTRLLRSKVVVSHDSPSVTGVENPSKRLGKVIRWADNARDMMHDKVLLFLPFLNGKVLDINMTGAFSRNTIVNHIDSRDVITINRSSCSLCIPQFLHNGT